MYSMRRTGQISMKLKLITSSNNVQNPFPRRNFLPSIHAVFSSTGYRFNSCIQRGTNTKANLSYHCEGKQGKRHLHPCEHKARLSCTCTSYSRAEQSRLTFLIIILLGILLATLVIVLLLPLVLGVLGLELAPRLALPTLTTILVEGSLG